MHRFLFLSILTLTSVGGFVSVAHAASFPVLDSSFHLVPDAHDLDPLCLPGAPLSFGAVMEIVQRFVNMGITLGIFFFVVIMAWAGFLFIMSATNPESRSKAKGMLLNAAIGMLIVLSAWLMVDFVMKTLYNPNSSGWGPWNSILGDGPACVVGRETTPLFTGAISTTDLPAGGGTGSTGGGPTGTFDGSFTYQLNVEAQKSKMSPALTSLLTCMASKLPRGVGEISAITDKYSGTDATRIAYCAKNGSAGSPANTCAHTANSCHYGGSMCVGQAFSADFGDEQNRALLINAANACGAVRAAYENNNHVHVTAPNQCGVGGGVCH